MPTVDQWIVWIVVGLIGGSLAGLIVKRDREGFGVIRNLGLGLAGALVGGLLFRLLRLWPSLDQIAISLRDVVSALVGSMLVLVGLWAWQHWKPAP
ncbi:MAG: GlsB/YeaQ/YmgE family stress response membrane protein [Hyphomicrobiaceae bacterium]